MGKFAKGGTFNSILMQADGLQERYDDSPNKSYQYTGSSEWNREQRFLSALYDLGRKVTPEEAERIEAEVQGED